MVATLHLQAHIRCVLVCTFDAATCAIELTCFLFTFVISLALTENKIVAEQRTFLTEKNSNRNVIPTNNSISFSSMILSDFLLGRMKKMLARPSANTPISSRKRSMCLYGVFSVATHVAFEQWCKYVYAFASIEISHIFQRKTFAKSLSYFHFHSHFWHWRVCVFFSTSLIIFY